MYTIEKLISGYQNKVFSPVEITKEYLERATQNSHLNAFISLTEKTAQQQAQIAEINWQRGEARPLEGIPISYKDNIHTKNIPSTSGSKMDENFTPNAHAEVVNKLNQAGGIMIGKNNMHEFAFGITNNNPFYGPAKNPWDMEMISGGSSGGSAVAVATDLSVASIGTDTGGSIRIPAASCGVVGLKPTYNMLSASGLTPISWTLDTPGPITRNINDLIAIIEALTNEDFSVIDPHAQNLKGIKIGVPIHFFTEKIEAKVLEAYETTLEQFESLGAHLVQVEVPDVYEALSLALTIAIAEGGYTHKDRMAHIDQYGKDVGQVIQASKSILALDYIHALKRRVAIIAKFDELLENVDALITPTLPALPKPIGQKFVEFDGEKEPIFNCMTRYTSYFNLTGHPAISLPVAQVKDLPIGVQLISGKWKERQLISISKIFEEQFLQDFYNKRLAITTGS